MMKRLQAFVLVFMLIFASCACAESTNPAEPAETTPDFKQFYWGDSKETIIAVEGDPALEGQMTAVNAEYIAYETTAVGLDVLLAYYFCDEGLYEVRYILTEKHSNNSLYIDDYNTFKAALTKKYGTPILDKENWENDSKKSYYADRKGTALCYGYLTYSTFYWTDRSLITMNMSADNYDISMIVYYESITISPGEADYSGDI